MASSPTRIDQVGEEDRHLCLAPPAARVLGEGLPHLQSAEAGFAQHAGLLGGELAYAAADHLRLLPAGGGEGIAETVVARQDAPQTPHGVDQLGVAVQLSAPRADAGIALRVGPGVVFGTDGHGALR